MHQIPAWPAAAAVVVVGIQHRHQVGFDREDLVDLEEGLDLEGIAVLVYAVDLDLEDIAGLDLEDIVDLDLEDIAALVFVVDLLATEFVEEVGIDEVWLRDMGWIHEAVATVGHVGLEGSGDLLAAVEVVFRPWSTQVCTPEENR